MLGFGFITFNSEDAVDHVMDRTDHIIDGKAVFNELKVFV